jgi:HK97 gp10 family phage protein
MPPRVVEVKITGAAELYEALERAPHEIAKKIIREGLKRAAGLWREEMVARVARGWHHWKNQPGVQEWGFLSEHIGMKATVRGDELEGSCQVGPVKKGFWSSFLEFGTSRMSAQPFIRQSFEARKEDVLEEFIKTCREKLALLGR